METAHALENAYDRLFFLSVERRLRVNEQLTLIYHLCKFEREYCYTSCCCYTQLKHIRLFGTMSENSFCEKMKCDGEDTGTHWPAQPSRCHPLSQWCYSPLLSSPLSFFQQWILWLLNWRIACCLSSFYLLPWFIFISSRKRRTEGHPVPLFCPRQANLTAESKDISSCVSHPIVSQRHGNITGLREMIALPFYGLLQGEHWIRWPHINDIHPARTTGVQQYINVITAENCLFLSYYRTRNYTIFSSVITSFSIKMPFS